MNLTGIKWKKRFVRKTNVVEVLNLDDVERLTHLFFNSNIFYNFYNIGYYLVTL